VAGCIGFRETGSSRCVRGGLATQLVDTPYAICIGWSVSFVTFFPFLDPSGMLGFLTLA
jgi:hypothetical protein